MQCGVPAAERARDGEDTAADTVSKVIHKRRKKASEGLVQRVRRL